MPELRRLNDAGIARFSEYIAEGAHGDAPVGLLTDPVASEPLRSAIQIHPQKFADRYAFGTYLVQTLTSLDAPALSGDRGIWTALALFFFDQLCPADPDGSRKPRKEYVYILSPSWQHYYRHLVRSPWQLVRDHGENARFLLLATATVDPHPLSRHSDMLEQVSGTQGLLRNRTVVAEAARLYGDPESGRPKRRASGKGAGSIRRLARVLRQFDLTFDTELMPPGKLARILPTEFNAWKADSALRATKASESTTSAVAV